jgi:bla regulator protein blaR1
MSPMSAYLADWLPLIQSLGWTLLHFLWQGAVIAAGYAAVRVFVPASHAEARYASGLAALALIAICPPLTLAIVYPHVVIAAANAEPVAIDAVVATAGAASDGASLDWMLPWLVLSWVLGVAVMAWRAFRQWQALERIAQHCAKPSSELERMLASLSRRFGLVRFVRVLVSSEIDTPTLIGWIKPVVLIPTAVALGFPRQQVELILAHELGHLRRYDHLVNLAQAVIETLLFYHPAVHWISREVRNDREVCCDRLVLRLTEGEPREYAQTLASLEELRLTPRVALAATGGVLLDRVRRIIDMPAPRLAAPRPTIGLTLLVAAAVLLAGISVLRPDRKDLDALAAGANALFDKLPRPDAALLVGLALRDPPKWSVALSPPKLARIADPAPAHAASADPIRAISVDALPRPAMDSSDELAPIRSLGPVSDVRTFTAASTAPAEDTVLPTVSSEARSVPGTRASARARHLVPVHVISPRYPDYREVKEPVRVDVQFSLNADGSVRDAAAVADSEANVAFGAAAEKAMRQWRFAPSTVPGDLSVRFQQSFVFARQSDVHRRSKGGEGEEFDCVRRTGSLVCRQPQEAEVAVPLTIIEANPNVALLP